MSEYVLEMTFNSQTRLTPGEKSIKYCLKFLAKNFRYYSASLTTAARLTNLQSCCRVFGTLYCLSDTVRLNLLSVTGVWSTV